MWGVRLQTLMKLRKIRRELRKSDRQYYRTLRKSGKKQEECTGETWYLDWMIDNIWSEAQERKAISDELEYQAQKLYLPTPSLDNEEDWDTDHANPPTRFLTAKAMSELRSAIRKERAERDGGDLRGFADAEPHDEQGQQRDLGDREQRGDQRHAGRARERVCDGSDC